MLASPILEALGHDGLLSKWSEWGRPWLWWIMNTREPARGHSVTSSSTSLFSLHSLVSNSACALNFKYWILCLTLPCCSVDSSPSCLVSLYLLVFVLGSEPESNRFVLRLLFKTIELYHLWVVWGALQFNMWPMFTTNVKSNSATARFRARRLATFVCWEKKIAQALAGAHTVAVLHFWGASSNLN